jgi:phage terminase large subunit
MTTRQERLKLLRAVANDKKKQNVLREKCKRDIHFWFNNFCYTFDPRKKPAAIPFNLMGFQEKVVTVICHCIDHKEPLIIEKSRDMGATWLILLVFQHYWMFERGSTFLVGSKKEDLVDKKGDLSTLFQKMRYNLQWQPPWLIPKLSKFDDGYMKLVNPTNGNTITGESSNPTFGIGQRHKGVMMDEMAFHPFGKAAYECISQTTNCIIMPSTPNGKTNEFYRFRSGEEVEWIDINNESDLDTLDVA